MNIQIFGTKKCSDTKKAERFFKERNIKFQSIDLNVKGFAKGELQRITKKLKADDLVDREGKSFQNSQYKYMQFDAFELILEKPEFAKTPIVSNGPESTVGYSPEVWEQWIKK